MHRPQSDHPRAADNQQDRNIMRTAKLNLYLTSNRIAVEVNFFGDTSLKFTNSFLLTLQVWLM